MKDSTGPVVLITGAGGGLGQVLMKAFRDDGWRVAGGYRVLPSNLETDVHYSLEIDVTNKSQIERSVERLVNECGRIDCLLNNAGMIEDALSWQIEELDWQKIMEVNLKGAFFCAQAVSMQMIKQRNGHIINIGSYSGRRGTAGQAHYSAAKAGLVGLGQSLAREIGSRNVRVNTVLPGLLPTRMTSSLAPEQLQNLVNENALRRINNLEEVARFIVFLAKMQNVSGQVFQLDSRIAKWM